MRDWHPTAIRDIHDQKGGIWSGDGFPKIVLHTTEVLAKPDWSVNGGTPHFTFDIRPNGKLWQHIPLSRSAYTMLAGANSPNREGGIAIQIEIVGRARYVHDWSDEQYRRLGNLVDWICTEIGAPEAVPFAFKGESDAYGFGSNTRVSWDAWVGAAGIVGHQHAPYNDHWDPGPIDVDKLLLYARPGATPGGGIGMGAEYDDEGRMVEEGTDVDTDEVELARYVEDQDISTKAFRFNPPLHAHSLPQRVDFGSIRSANRSLVDYLDESGIGRNWTESDVGKQGKKFHDLRLGRIIQDRTAVGYAATMKYRHGFRFLYNPTQVSVSASRNSSVILDGRSAHNMVLSGINQNFQTITFKLVLNRIPDVMLPSISDGDYSPRLYAGQRKKIRERGTHFDLEYLYRVCNGAPVLEDRGKTGDIGVIIPANARLILGKGQNFFGFVQSISYEDVMFSPDMVPIKTDVNVTFRRHVDISYQQTEAWEARFSSIYDRDTSTSIDEDDEDSGSSSGSSTTVANNKDAPVPGFNTVTNDYDGGHAGWDYGSGGIDGQRVHATMSGVVDFVGWAPPGSGTYNPRTGQWSYGYYVRLITSGVQHIYGHLRGESSPLKKGQTVKAGDFLGKVGDTGNSSGPHLHYEERVNGRARRPQWAKRY